MTGVLDLAAARRLLAATLSASDRVRIGAEVEWLVHDRTVVSRPVTVAESRAAAVGSPLPAEGTVSFEPGGQVELSTPVVDDPIDLLRRIDADVAVLVDRFATAGLALVPRGLDRARPSTPTLDAPRYHALEAHFRRWSPDGVVMMASTAALQISVDLGPAPLRTWQALDALAPVLSASFADRPELGSDRQRVWARTDPSRTARAVPTHEGWADAVLGATVLLRAGDRRPPWTTRRSFASWLDDGADGPTAADLVTHLSTMFPPLRPRRHLEVRCIDAVPRTGRLAAIGLVWLLATDGDVAAAAIERGGDVASLWARSLASGLSDPLVRAHATWLFDVASTVLDPPLADACDAWWSTLDDRLASGTRAIDLLAEAEPSSPSERAR